MSEKLDIQHIIKIHMVYKDWKIIDLAKNTGISPSTLGRKLKGEGEFTICEAKKIAEAFNFNDPWNVFFNTKSPKT